MYLRKSIFLVALLMLTHYLYAENGEWFPGYLYLKSQTKLQGEIWVRVDYNVVVFRRGGEMVVYPAYKVQSVSIYDESQEKNRNFISLQLEVGAATLHQLYEVALEGQITMLRKQRVLWYSIHLDVPEEDYFIWNNNEVVSLYYFRRKVFPKLLKSNPGTKSFIRDHKLHPNRLEDMVEILTHYNQNALNENQLAKKE